MNHDVVFWAVIACVTGSIVILFGLFYMLARQAKKSANGNTK
jgi:hypothetical protein